MFVMKLAWSFLVKVWKHQRLETSWTAREAKYHLWNRCKTVEFVNSSISAQNLAFFYLKIRLWIFFHAFTMIGTKKQKKCVFYHLYIRKVMKLFLQQMYKMYDYQLEKNLKMVILLHGSKNRFLKFSGSERVEQKF